MTMTTNDPIVFSYKHEIRISVPKPTLDNARKAINMAWIGKENCNKVDKKTGKIVSAVTCPNMEDKLTKAHHGLCMTEAYLVTIHVHKSGKKTIEL